MEKHLGNRASRRRQEREDKRIIPEVARLAFRRQQLMQRPEWQARPGEDRIATAVRRVAGYISFDTNLDELTATVRQFFGERGSVRYLSLSSEPLNGWDEEWRRRIELEENKDAEIFRRLARKDGVELGDGQVAWLTRVAFHVASELIEIESDEKHS